MEEDYKYILVLFENKDYPFTSEIIRTNPEFRQQVYGSAKPYLYRTKKEYTVGKVISIYGSDRITRVLIVRTNIPETELNFPKDKVKDLPVVEGEN